MVINYSNDEYPDGTKNNMVYIHTHLNKKPFWKRLMYGIKYIFGYKCRYGAFDEFIVNPKDADKIQEIVYYLKKIEK
jgi:hypothetical protein